MFSNDISRLIMTNHHPVGRGMSLLGKNIDKEGSRQDRASQKTQKFLDIICKLIDCAPMCDKSLCKKRIKFDN